MSGESGDSGPKKLVTTEMAQAVTPKGKATAEHVRALIDVLSTPMIMGDVSSDQMKKVQGRYNVVKKLSPSLSLEAKYIAVTNFLMTLVPDSPRNEFYKKDALESFLKNELGTGSKGTEFKNRIVSIVKASLPTEVGIGDIISKQDVEKYGVVGVLDVVYQALEGLELPDQQTALQSNWSRIFPSYQGGYQKHMSVFQEHFKGQNKPYNLPNPIIAVMLKPVAPDVMKPNQ